MIKKSSAAAFLIDFTFFEYIFKIENHKNCTDEFYLRYSMSDLTGQQHEIVQLFASYFAVFFSCFRRLL